MEYVCLPAGAWFVKGIVTKSNDARTQTVVGEEDGNRQFRSHRRPPTIPLGDVPPVAWNFSGDTRTHVALDNRKYPHLPSVAHSTDRPKPAAGRRSRLSVLEPGLLPR